jgi:DNA repair protein RecN (Recombination protein N)
MLLELKVSNFAIIDNVQISFRPGLNILSGETGAGKSILLRSLGLLMGDKAATEGVRTGAEQAVIEGSFDIADRPDIAERLEEMGIDASEALLVVRRIVSRENKARVYLNGSPSTLGALREVVAPLVEVAGQAAPLIEMTGQHENRNLMSRSYHLELLDQYCGAWKLRAEFAALFHSRQSLSKEIESLRQESRHRAQRLDFLAYQRDEIRALGLKPGEEEEIESEARRLKHATRLLEFAEQAEGLLYSNDESVAGRLGYLLQRGAELKNLDPLIAARLGPLAQARALIEEASYDLREYAKGLESDPSRLEEIQGRLSALRQVQKKYGSTASEILEALANIESEIHSLEHSDELIEEKEACLARVEKDLSARSGEMHKKREGAAALLAKGVNDELKDLNMKGVSFCVAVEAAAELGPTGATTAEFMTQNSKADTPRPLARFASGGELSRVLLSLKRAIGATGRPRTYLFDEVDSGVSGPTAEKVGRKLRAIARGQQVICVTHLPQVASFGDAHFIIAKSKAKASAKKGVNADVIELRKDDRVKEIARLISGEKITQTSIAHAAQLLAESARP